MRVAATMIAKVGRRILHLGLGNGRSYAPLRFSLIYKSVERARRAF